MTTSRIRIAFLEQAQNPRRAAARAHPAILRNWLASIVVMAGVVLAGAVLAGVVLAGVVLAALAAVPAAHATPDAPQRTLLILGDSISAAYGIQREQGWVRQLEERLATVDPAWRVVNASVSGETTGGGLARLPAALATHDPAVVVIELGGNDALRGYPLGKIRENLTEMVDLSRAAGGEVLLVGMQIPPNYGPRYTRGFAGLFHEVAQQQAVALVPFLLEQVALAPDLMQADGIHPTAAAQPLLLETLWPHLAPLLDKVAKEVAPR